MKIECKNCGADKEECHCDKPLFRKVFEKDTCQFCGKEIDENQGTLCLRCESIEGDEE